MAFNFFGGDKNNEDSGDSRSRRGWVPTSDFGVLETSRRVCDHGLRYVDYIDWVEADAFIAKTNDYDNYLNKRYSTGAEKQYTVSLSAGLINRINTASSSAVRYLKEVNDPHLDANCARLGFKTNKRGRYFPVKDNTVLEAVERMVENFPKMPFAPEQVYDLVFWQGILAELQQLKTEKSSTDSQLNSHIDQKNQLKEDLRTILKSIVHQIRSQHTDNTDAMLRKAGFQRNR